MKRAAETKPYSVKHLALCVLASAASSAGQNAEHMETRASETLRSHRSDCVSRSVPPAHTPSLPAHVHVCPFSFTGRYSHMMDTPTNLNWLILEVRGCKFDSKSQRFIRLWYWLKCTDLNV